MDQCFICVKKLFLLCCFEEKDIDDKTSKSSHMNNDCFNGLQRKDLTSQLKQPDSDYVKSVLKYISCTSIHFVYPFNPI